MAVAFTSLATTTPTVKPYRPVTHKAVIANVYEAQQSRKTDFSFVVVDFYCGSNAQYASDCVNEQHGTSHGGFGTGFLGAGQSATPSLGYNAGGPDTVGQHQVHMIATGCVICGSGGSCQVGSGQGSHDGYEQTGDDS